MTAEQLLPLYTSVFVGGVIFGAISKVLNNIARRD